MCTNSSLQKLANFQDDSCRNLHSHSNNLIEVQHVLNIRNDDEQENYNLLFATTETDLIVCVQKSNCNYEENYSDFYVMTFLNGSWIRSSSIHELSSHLVIGFCGNMDWFIVVTYQRIIIYNRNVGIWHEGFVSFCRCLMIHHPIVWNDTLYIFAHSNRNLTVMKHHLGTLEMTTNHQCQKNWTQSYFKNVFLF
jgi:hypothetical protein